jgi:hypothetical protein
VLYALHELHDERRVARAAVRPYLLIVRHVAHGAHVLQDRTRCACVCGVRLSACAARCVPRACACASLRARTTNVAGSVAAMAPPNSGRSTSMVRVCCLHASSANPGVRARRRRSAAAQQAQDEEGRLCRSRRKICCPFPSPRRRPCSAPRAAKMSGSESEEEELEQTKFETADAGASHTYPQTASGVRKGGFMVIKGRPCKARQLCLHASRMSFSRPRRRLRSACRHPPGAGRQCSQSCVPSPGRVPPAAA